MEANPENLEYYFKDLFTSSNDLIHFANIDGSIHLANPKWLQTLGYNLSEVQGHNIREFIHPQFRDSFLATRYDMIKTGQVHHLETVYLTKSGEKVICEGYLACLVEGEKSQYTRGVFKDISKRKLTEMKLEDSEKRLKTFFENAPDAVVIINQDELIQEWNPRAEVIFGFKANEVIGKRLSETIIPQQYRESHRKGMKHFLLTGEGPVLHKTIEITALHQQGHEFYINLSISNVEINGEWYFIAFLSDISGRKRTEEALIHKEAELIQSRLLEEKKNQFMSVASHELKTPLTTLKAYTHLALNASPENTPEIVLDFLHKSDHSIEKLNRLINELLDVSRIQAGKLALSIIETDFSRYFEEVLNAVRIITTSHELILEKNEKAMIMIDPIRLEQVITNIINNAAKYSPGKKVIRLRSEIVGNNLEVSIRDYGIGIAKDEQDKIFTRFFRIDRESKRFSGMGIGLYVSSEIVKQHKGSIHFESTPDEGTTFFIQLPLLIKE